MSIFTQIVILTVVLASMVMVLLAIRQLTNFEGFEDKEETAHLKNEIENEDKVISDNNIFHNLIGEKKKTKFEKKEYYKDNSKDPLSRKE